MESESLVFTGLEIPRNHGDNEEAAEQLYQLLAEEFPEAQIKTADIGPIIGTHTEPGMLALIYWENNR